MQEDIGSKDSEKPAEKKRTTLLSVENAESAMAFFTCFTLIVVIALYIYLKYVKNKCFLDALIIILENNPKILAGVTMCLVIKEGIDIMLLKRVQRYLTERKQIIEKAKKEAYDKGYNDAQKEFRNKNEKNGSSSAKKK